MRRFDRYLFRETLPPLVFSLLLYSTLAVISVTLPRLQWIVGTPLGPLGQWLLLQFPAALVQTLPIALVLAVLLVFGRLASSNELIAAQAGGISLRRIAMSFVLLSGLFAGLALAMNEWVVPRANAQVGSLYWPLTTGGSSGLWRLAARDIPLDGYTLHFARTNPATDELYDVRVESWQGRRLTVLLAERARFTPDGLRLTGYQVATLDLGALAREHASSEEALRRLLLSYTAPADPAGSFLVSTSTPLDTLIAQFSGGGFEDVRSISAAYRDANSPASSPRERRQAAVLFHRKLVEPLANLTVLLMAIPLSLLYARSRSVAFGLSLAVTLLWYLLLTVGQLLAQTGTVPIWLGMWVGNFVLLAAGSYLLLFRTRRR
jgi:lipopolysaccharide export system permease protein